MSNAEITWTEAELDRFDQLTLMLSSPNQLSRINARLHMPEFIQKHGKAKCDAMFAEIKRRESQKRKKGARILGS